MIFDTHVHYDDEQFDSDREELLSALTAAGIGAAVDVGSTPESLDKLMEIARTHDHIYAAVGIHPDEVGSITDEVWDKIREYLTDSKVVAVGEIGLDYYWDKEAHEMQESWRDIPHTLEMIDLFLEDDELFAYMCQNILCNKKSNVYDGAYNVVKLAMEMRR